MIPRAIPIKNLDLFELAVRHRSATKHPLAESYERLEFFGDSILGFVIAEYLYQHYPDWDQGVMSKAKATVVQEGPLAQAALRLGLDQYLQLSPGEDALSGRTRPSILADAFEAIIGAIYLESGMNKARWFVLEQLHRDLVRLQKGEVSPFDYKSKLQEITQSLWRKIPTYNVIHESGQRHQKNFVVQVILDDEVLGEGEGKSKKEAEQGAAKEAYLLIKRAHQEGESDKGHPGI